MIYLYSDRPSNGLAALREQPGFKGIKRHDSNFSPRPTKVVVNWGCSSVPDDLLSCSVVNRPEVVLRCLNKLMFFHDQEDNDVSGSEFLVSPPTPRLVPWTESAETALGWCKSGHFVVCRSVLTGHSGDGIVVVQQGDVFPSCPLYTRYVKKDQEYRVHMMNGEVIDVQRKIRNPQQVPADWKVRSHRNGFIYTRNNFTVPDDVLEQSRRSFLKSGLDFGAFDVLWNQHYSEAYVLEVNCRPGLEGQTVLNYASSFRRCYG